MVIAGPPWIYQQVTANLDVVGSCQKRPLWAAAATVCKVELGHAQDRCVWQGP